MKQFIVCLFAVLILAAAVPIRAQAPQARGYARFCSSMLAPPRADGTSYRSGMAGQIAASRERRETDPDIAHAVQAILHLTSPPTVVVRNAGAFFGERSPEKVYLSDLDPKNPHWWEAIMVSPQEVGEVHPADAKRLRGVLGMARGMAAYVVFNELMGGDDPFPSTGCDDLDDAWFGDFSAILPRFKAALRIRIVPDAAFKGLILQAWDAIPTTTLGNADALALSKETFSTIGRDPQLEIVYRDSGVPGDGIGELDIVRIGGSVHTYAMVTNNGMPVKITTPSCVVSDLRCGAYYVWP